METLLIRADAGENIGAGHLMRMLALAQAWSSYDRKAVFATVSCPDSLCRNLREEQFTQHSLGKCAIGSRKDSLQTTALASKLKPSWIVLDGYRFEKAYQQDLQASGFRTLVVDDGALAGEWTGNLLLNQNFSAAEFSYQNDTPDSNLLLGERYTLLREEFRVAWEAKIEEPADRRGRNLLVTLGGFDSGNINANLLKVLNRISSPQLKIRILGPRNYLPQNGLAILARESPHSVEILEFVDDMVSQYNWADKIISAGGSTCYEWLLFDKPAAVICVAANQIPTIKHLETCGLALSLGSPENLQGPENVERITSWLKQDLSKSPQRQRSLDPFGALRVCARLAGKSFFLRKASPGDCRSLFELSNESSVRKASFSTSPITWSEHVLWFKKALLDREMWISAVEDVHAGPIGFVRFAFTSEKSTISIAIIPQYRGKQLGGSIIKTAVQQFLSEHAVPTISAFIKESNIGSIKAFENAGFILFDRFEKQDEPTVEMRWQSE